MVVDGAWVGRATYRGVGVEMRAHVLNLQLELLLRPALGALGRKIA